LWVDHLLSKKRTRNLNSIGGFVEGSIELNCIMIRHGSQESECERDVYKQRGC